MNKRVHFTSAMLWLLVASLSSGVSQAGDRIKVISGKGPGIERLKNGGFEQTNGPAWAGWHQGFEWAPGEGRSNSTAVRCVRTEAQGEFGAGQTLVLNRTSVAPFVIHGWSKATNVSGSPDSGYSLYVDILYTDGTPLWGRSAPFSCGTHDWERREFIVFPEKPVKSITLHCLFRGHTGEVLFDDASLQEIPVPTGATLLHGVPVHLVPNVKTNLDRPFRKFSTRDGLALRLADDGVVSLRVSDQEIRSSAPSAFLARDYGESSDYIGFDDGSCGELGLRLETKVAANSNHIAISGSLADLRKQDRAITLLFSLPISGTGWTWGDNIRQGRPIEGDSEFVHLTPTRSGAAQHMSRYPFGCIWNKTTGLAIGIDMDRPAQYTIAFNPGTGQFFVAYDFGLSSESSKWPSQAHFKFVLFRFDPEWGFRSALQKYYEIFPEHFRKRVEHEGLWMPFTDISQVPGHQDFGFAFQEGAPNVRFDDACNIFSFVYVEPTSHWMSLPPGVPRTYPAAVDVLEKNLTSQDPEKRRMAAATMSSGIHDPGGKLALYLVKAPWCDGGVFTLNPDPDVPTNSTVPWNKASVMRHAVEQAFQKNAAKSQTNAPHPGLDGLYLDSLEMASADLNYRREHFAGADVPLVFDQDGRVCQMMIFNTWEFARAMANDLHARQKLTFANGALWTFSFPAPLLDVLGTEVNWLRDGKYAPDPDSLMTFRRAMCYQKPYCLLMNTDYRKFTPELVEHYFQSCLFYGMWPGFFDEEAASKDPYWASKNQWYERDRNAFKRYIPLLKKVTSAGWEPLTLARCDNNQLWIERFGGAGSRQCYIAVHNNSKAAQQGTIIPDHQLSTFADKQGAEDLVSGETFERSGTGWRVSLRPGQTVLLQARPGE